MTTFGAAYIKKPDEKAAPASGEQKFGAAYAGKGSTSANTNTGANFAPARTNSSPTLPSLGEFYANTINKMKNDPANRATYELALNTVTTDPTSPYYNPYSQATTTSKAKTYSDRVNDAYSDLNGLYSELSYWASRTDRAYTDDEIISKINMGNYKTLQKMDEGRASGKPYEMSSPVPYAGKDTMKGMLWSIRNGGQTSGDYAVDSAMNYMGRGNVSPESRYAHMADATLETYAPYKAGRSVTTDKYAYQFGATADFDDSWLLAHDYLKNTEEGSKIYYDIYTANENTKKYEASVAAFNDFVESQIEYGSDPSQFLNPDNLAVHDWGKDILKLVEGQNSGKLVETTRPLDFDWGDVQRRAQEAFEREEAKVPAEKFEEDVATALKADEPVKKPDGFFKNTFKKTRDWVVGLFADEATEEETVALKADDGSFDDVKESVTHSIETSTATTDDMYDIALNEADYYAVKNLLPARHRQKELEEEIAGYKAVGEFIAKWEKKLEDGSANPADIYSDPEYIADFQAVEKYYDAYEENGGDVSALEAELEEQKATQAEVMRRYDAAAQYQGYDSGNSALPYLEFADQFYGMTDETLAVPSYQWQDALASGEAKWEEVSPKLDGVVKQYNGLIQNINTAIEIGEAGGLDQSVIDGMQAYKRALKKEQEAIKVAQLQNNPDFEAKVKEFEDTVQTTDANWGWVERTFNVEDVVPENEYVRDFILTNGNPNTHTANGVAYDQAKQMTAEEQNLYKYLYMTQGEEKAYEYFKGLTPALNRRGYEATKEEGSVEGEGFFGGVAKNVGSVATNLISFAPLLINLGESLAGNEVDPYSPINYGTAWSSSVRETSKNAIETNEWLNKYQFFKPIAMLGYDAAMTSADSTAAAATGSGLLVMAASSAQTTLIDAKLRGASDAQAFLLAGCSAAVETATEYLPMDEMLDTFKKAGTLGVKDLIGKIVIGTLEEAPGEMISELVGGISDDLIMQEMAASELRIKQLREEEGLSPQEAKARAMHEAATDILYAGLLSFGTSTGSQTIAYGAGKIFNVGDYARSNPEVEGVNADEVIGEAVEIAEEDQAAKEKAEELATSTSSPSSNTAPQKNTTPSAPVTTTTKTVATPQEKAAVVQRDNKILSGGYVLGSDGKVVPKEAKRKLTFGEKAAIALKEAIKGKNTSSAATLSATLQIFGNVDAVTSDAIAKSLVAKYGNEALSQLQVFAGENLENVSGEELTALIVSALTNKNGKASNFFSSNSVSSSMLLEAVADSVATVTKEQITNFVKKNAVAGATVDILKRTDMSRFDALRKQHRDANTAYKKASDAASKLVYEVSGLQQKASEYRGILRHNPANEKVKNSLIDTNNKLNELISKRDEAVAERDRLYRDLVELEKSTYDERQRLIVNARSEATALVDNYLAEQAKSEEAAKLQAEAEAAEAAARAIAQQEADNLSEMEFQSYVEETAPDATSEQVEEMRQEFGEQREAVEQIRAEQVAKEEANGNVQTPEQKKEAKAIENAKAIGKRFKTNVKTMALPSKIKGWFNRDGNELVLNSNLSQEQMLEETVVHEFSHKAEDGGRAYDSYSQALLDLAYGGDRKKIKAEIQKVKGKRNKELAQMTQTGGEETYGKDLRFIDDDGARKELVAQATKELLKGDPDLIDKFVNADVDAAYSFFDRLKFVLKRMVGIKGTYAEQLKHTTYLFQKALAKAAENGAKTTKQRVAESKHPASVQFSIDQWAKATGFKFERSSGSKGGYVILDQDGNKIDKVTKEMMDNTPAGKLVDTALNKGSMTAAEADSAKQFLADVMNMVVEFEDQETVWELVGSALFSSVKNNSDKQYGRTVDYGTICSKTRDIVNVMSETMLEKGRGLTREEVIMAYNKTFGEGMSVPCPPCYVFSRWMGVPSLLETMRKGQERFANATDADVNEYINAVKERYAGELAKTKKNGEAKTLAEVMGTRKTNILNKLDAIRQEVASERFDESALDKVREQQKALEAELEDIELYNWVTQVLCETDSKGKPIEKNGKVSIDKKFKAVPNEVLLDMRKTGEFASGYAKAWKFRTTRGAGMGKAQLPYAGAEVGDVLTGAKRWKANENPFYTGDDAKAKRALANATKRTKAQNLIGGNRFQSTSDFRPEWGLDYLMTFFEMEAIGAKGQLYTKVIEAVDLFASAGVEVNLSVMAKGDGWHLNENGNPVITLEDFSPVTGIDAEQAMQKSQEYDNVQLILVGMNDTHIELALADDRISFVIPWHSSGNSKEVLGQMMEAVGESRGKAQNYEEFQTDKIGNQTPEQKAAWDLRKKILTGGFFVKGKAVEPTEAEMATIAGNDYLLNLYNKMYVDETSDSYHVKLSAAQASQIFPHEYWDTNSTYDTADVNGKRFVEYCESMGIEPRFPQFADKKGYWKLLIDRRMYGRDGNYRPAGYISTSNIKVNALPQSVSQAKPGTNEQIQNAKQKLIDEIDARTAEQHKFDLSAEHAAPAPAIPANVQFSLRDDSSSDWDVDASAEDSTVIEEETAPEEPSNEPSGIYADPKAGDDSDYGAEDEPVKPTNEFTYGTLDPAFKIPEAPKGKRVHDTSRKIVADESLPDAVRMEEAKPENSQYEQDSNEAQHNRAAEIIRRRGIDNEYERLMKLESASSPDDIAEILILEQFYNREGTRDMEKLLGVTKKKRQLSAVAATILQSTKSEIAKMSPTELVSRFLGESEDSLENFIKEHPKAAEKIKERADAKTEALSASVAGKSLDEVSEDNKWYTPLNAAQMAVIKEYGLENVERAGIFYNRATVKQRMLEAIIQTKDPFAMTGMGMNLIERLEYIRSGAQAITIADLNYIQRNLGEFSFFDGLQGGRVSDLALNRAYEAYGNTKTASFFEKFRSMRYVNMLTSFTSAFKNIIGNASMIAVENVSHEVENVVDLGVGLISGKRTKQSLTVQERLAGWEAFKDECVNTFRDYFVDKVDTNPKNDPFNTHRKGRVYQGKVTEEARNLQGFLMSFGDRNFWKRAYVNSLSEQQKLLDKGLLLNEDGSVPTMDQMIERAKGEADYAVLSEDNFVSKTFRRLAVEHPVAAEMISYYMPFTGVPTNVIKRAVEYSPLNAVATVGEALWRGFRGKTFNQKKFVEGVCRPLTAAGVYMLGSMLYNAGKIKMGTGDDEDEGTKYYDARTALGDQYSAYLVDDISGTNASLSSLGPVGTMLLFGAAMSSELDKQGEDGKRYMAAAWNALNHNFDSIVDASYLSGITDFFNSNLDESFFETGIRLFGENVAGQMIPAPVAQFAEYLDPYVRDTKDKNKIIEIYKSVANKIPYLRETLPKKVYVTGVVAETRRPPVTKFVDPFTRSHQYEEPELEEAMRLYEFAKNSSDPDIAGNAKSVLPEDVLRNKKTSFKYNGAEYELNDEQKEAYKLKYGEIWTAKVAARMNDRGWAAYDDETKFKLIKSDMSKSKAETMEWAIANLIDY